MDYNATVNLPKTDFPMRAGLPKREPDMLKAWYDMDLYHEMVRRNEGVMLTWDYTAISRQPVEGCVFRQLYQEDFGVNVYLLENPKVHRSADCEIVRDFLLQWISSRLEGPPWAEKNDGVY